MTGKPEWVAADWGCTHLRLWMMAADNSVLDRRTTAQGADGLDPDDFEAALLAALGNALPADGRLQVICCGMAGAASGWSEAPYAEVPRPPGQATDAVFAPVTDRRLDVRILPGLSQRKPPDVMRGEETEIAGFLAATPGFDGVLCLPGTHCKWAHVSAGEVVSFRTFMTGELFGLLGAQSVLRHCVASTGWDAPAFAEALDRSLSRPEAVAADLFGLRAAALINGAEPETTRARLSGLLIGLELAAARPFWLGQDVAVVGSGVVADCYATALRLQGLQPRRATDGEMALGGLIAARNQLKKSP